MAGTMKATVLVLAMLVIAGCATQDITKDTVEVRRMQDVRILSPGGVDEECVEIFPGQLMEYTYSASGPVNFNIHYHGMDKVHYPVRNTRRKSGGGVLDPGTHAFYSEVQENYCLMFESKSEKEVKLSFECIIRKHKD